MTNLLSTLRDELVEALDANGITAHTTVPEVWTPPGVFVGPDLPYLDFEGATFGGVLVHHQLTVVGPAGVNDVQVETLDDLILQILAALPPGEWSVESVDQPGRIVLNGQNYLAAAIHLTPHEIRL